MSRQVALDKLVLDESIYPRKNINESHVRSLVLAMEGGAILPPIIVERESNRIVDGVHRYHAAQSAEHEKIAVEYRTYANETELFKEAVILNTGHGLRLDTYDTLKVLEIGSSFGLKELEIAGILRTSIAHLRAIAPRYATVEEARDGVSELRKVALKASVRHLRGQVLLPAQEAAIDRAPGQSYLMSVRQLIDGLEHDLLPPETAHPTLWTELSRLCSLISGRMVA